MIKYIFLVLFPWIVSASLINSSNHNKEVALLESFDIGESFLYDPILNDMRNKNNSIYKEQHFFKAMDDAYLFIPAIKNILVEQGVPLEFLYLAMAESNFSSRAYSKKQASGLWQFMAATGKIYGLKIDQYVDERRDPIKSTQAAAKYLSYLHQKFGKWYLAAIAYNCGEGRLSRAIEKAKSDEIDILLDESKKYIPKESRYYIRKIVALALVGNDEDYMLNSEYEHLLNRASAYSISTVHLPSGEMLRRVSQSIGIPLEQLKNLNRHLKYEFVPPYADGYSLYIPYIKLAEFKQKYQEDSIANIYKVHVVQRGDNLSALGKKYGVGYQVIMDFNKLRSSMLRLNQKLIIPIAKKESFAKKKAPLYYFVKQGDTLASISKSYQVTVQALKTRNALSDNIIRVGDRLKIYE